MWYGGDFLEKLLSTYCVNPAGKYFGMSPWSWGLVEGLQRCTETRRRASAPGMSELRSKYRSLVPSGEPSRVSAWVLGPIARTLLGPFQVSESLALRTLASVSVFAPWRVVATVLYTHTQRPKTNLQCVGEG